MFLHINNRVSDSNRQLYRNALREITSAYRKIDRCRVC